MAQVPRSVGGKESIDLPPEGEADAISEVRRVHVGRIIPVRQSCEDQGLSNLLPSKSKEGTEDSPTALLGDSYEGTGSPSPEKVGQDRFDPIVKLVAKKDRRVGVGGKIGFKK